MHRQGHSGIVLLALACSTYGLLGAGRPLLAVLAWGVVWIEPLPDYDLRTPLLTHRGTSHSLVAAVVVGGCCAGLGWLLGTYLTAPLLPWLRAEVLLGSEWRMHVDVLDAASLSLVGFCLGAGGIVLHLLGDIITVSGIQPFLPFSQRRVRLARFRAASTPVNSLLFGMGVLAIVAVGVVVTPLDERFVTMLGFD